MNNMYLGSWMAAVVAFTFGCKEHSGNRSELYVPSSEMALVVRVKLEDRSAASYRIEEIMLRNDAKFGARNVGDLVKLDLAVYHGDRSQLVEEKIVIVGKIMAENDLFDNRRYWEMPVEGEILGGGRKVTLDTFRKELNNTGSERPESLQK